MDSAEITLAELADLTEGSYILIDTRDEISYEYGSLQDAVNIPDITEAEKRG